MKGLELSKRFYLEHGEKMLREGFGDILPFLAVGLVGSGSECFGFDDAISRDHDFEPGFCIFIPREDIIDSRMEFRLERAYAGLPKEFMGFKRSPLSPVGGNRHGVIRLEDFFLSKTGTADGSLSLQNWLTVPEYQLAEAVNGEIFIDNYGLFTEIRNKIKNMPEAVRLKKTAGNLLIMGQSGQYNYQRCISRGDTAAAQLCLYEFVRSTMQTAFLLSGEFMPYYKWQFRALSSLKDFCRLAPKLEMLISQDNSPDSVKAKLSAIEDISEQIIYELKSRQLSAYPLKELEGHAYWVNDSIKDNEIRNLHILCAV